MHKTRIIIDLAALAHNYNVLKQKTPSVECGAVVKADAYGLGVDSICKTLWQAGCKTYFTATLPEAIEVRNILPEARIYAFEGIRQDEIDYFQDYKIHPVLNDFDMIDLAEGQKLGAMLHIDTAMSRLGLHLTEAEEKKEKIISLFHTKDIDYIMTHLSCGDLLGHEMNQKQIERMQHVKKIFPDMPISMSNSWGGIYHPKMHHDLVRSGTALYGGITDPLFRPVMTLEGQILQIRKVYAGEAIGYSATYTAEKDMVIATLSGGYADGIPRHLSGTDYAVYYHGYKCPVVGRISMDSIMVDFSHIPEDLYEKGAWVEFFGNNIPLDEAAELAHTISYGILTGLGNRPERIYKS